jgi:hypothetical protein
MPKVEFHFDFGSPNAYLAHLSLTRAGEIGQPGLGYFFLIYEILPEINWTHRARRHTYWRLVGLPKRSLTGGYR